MCRDWLKIYRQVMLRSSIVSQIGSFIVLMIAASELALLVRAISYAENASYDAVSDALIYIIPVLVSFGVRFFVMVRQNRYSLWVVSASWWLTFIGVAIGVVTSGPSGGGLYDIFSAFPLHGAGIAYIVISILRFLATSIVVLTYPDERYIKH
jgi:hypothetical protein